MRKKKKNRTRQGRGRKRRRRKRKKEGEKRDEGENPIHLNIQEKKADMEVFHNTSPRFYFIHVSTHAVQHNFNGMSLTYI